MKAVREERVLRLTLDNPSKRNALHESLCKDLVVALEEAWRDDSVGCVLLDAEGEVFSAGMDLDEATRPDAADRTALHEALFTFGFHATKPVVAAVRGAALGGGLGLVANAHVVVAAHGTKFGLTELRLGMWPFVIWRAMVHAIGERRTVELAVTARIFGTPDALQLGLVHEVAPPIELDDRATAIAQAVAASSPHAMRIGLEYLRDARGLPLDGSGQMARDLRAKVFSGADFQEGVAAFREKRKPKWPSLARQAPS
ncbi:MAG: enoyl-CoA hydratase/isomerase family protein [Bryobacterales bacterium]|nr:enoyl-CoA hydratase/isomerase family protein [Bryobacterales bacterium]